MFKQGILNRDWDIIEKAYTYLTGETVGLTTKPKEVVQELPKPKRGRGRPRKHPLKSSMVTEPQIEEPSLSACTAPAQDPTKQKKLFTKATQHSCEPRTPTWKDDQSLSSNEIVKDRVVPLELQKHRPPVKMVIARCTSCGHRDQVDPLSVPYGLKLTPNYRMRYLCNNCIVGAKSGLSDVDINNDDTLYDDGNITGDID